MAIVTWLGDESPAAQIIEQYGHTFVKGEPVTVPDKDPYMRKFKAMSVFHVKGDDKGKPEPVESVKDEIREPVDPELQAARDALDDAGQKWHHKSSVETLRKQLAEHTAQ